jgi:hypothetical protein
MYKQFPALKGQFLDHVAREAVALQRKEVVHWLEETFPVDFEERAYKNCLKLLEGDISEFQSKLPNLGLKFMSLATTRVDFFEHSKNDPGIWAKLQREIFRITPLAIARGHMDFIKWRIENFEIISNYDDNFNDLVRIGNLEILECLREKKIIGKWDLTPHVRDGNLDFVKWALSHGLIKPDKLCLYAASPVTGKDNREKLELLKWARAQGHPWDKYVIQSAAGLSDLLLFKWAIKHGCPFSDAVIITELKR